MALHFLRTVYLSCSLQSLGDSSDIVLLPSILSLGLLPILFLSGYWPVNLLLNIPEGTLTKTYLHKYTKRLFHNRHGTI